MDAGEARRVVGTLFSAYGVRDGPRLAVYVRSVLDFTPAEAERAVNVLVATEPRLPPVARLRDVVFEERLQIPTEHEAWELVQRHVFHRSGKVDCGACEGRGYHPKDGAGPADDTVCDECRGQGIAPAVQRPDLDEVTKRALAFVGGTAAVRQTERPDVVRAQFGRAFEAFRQARMREANLVGLGVLEPAAQRLALERARAEVA